MNNRNGWRNVPAGQFGLFERTQVVGSDLTPRQLERLVASGEVERVRPRVYRVAGTPPSARQAVMAATLSSRGIASGRTAAALWNIPGFVIRENEIEVLVRAGKRFPRWSGVKVHRTKFLPDEDVHLVSGIPVTSPARTILMLGASESPSVVRRAAIHCLQNHLVTPEQLKHQLQIMGRCGLDGTAALRRVVAALTFDQELTDSDLEDAAEELLRKEGYPQPLLHFRYVEEGVLLGEIDLYWRELSLGIEADSWAFHSGRPEFQRDRGKQNSLVAAGVTILRFTPEDARRPRRFLTAFERTWERLSALCAR